MLGHPVLAGLEEWGCYWPDANKAHAPSLPSLHDLSTRDAKFAFKVPRANRWRHGSRELAEKDPTPYVLKSSKKRRVEDAV